MKIFAHQYTAQQTGWSLLASGYAFIPRRSLQLMVWGVVYETADELKGCDIVVKTSDGTIINAVYVG